MLIQVRLPCDTWGGRGGEGKKEKGKLIAGKKKCDVFWEHKIPATA